MFKKDFQFNFKMKNTILTFLLFLTFCVKAQLPVVENYNQIWTTQSNNSSESMPLGGGDIGANVWVEKGDLYFYFSRSGTLY